MGTFFYRLLSTAYCLLFYEPTSSLQAADTGGARDGHPRAHRLPLVPRLRAVGVGHRGELPRGDDDDAVRPPRHGRGVGGGRADDLRALPLHLRPRAFAR